MRVVGYADDASESSASSDRVPGHGGATSVLRWILLKRRVLSIEKYAAEQRRGGNASLSAADRMRLYGGNTIPVAVPLVSGETKEEYEEEFLQWLGEKGYTLSALRDDPNKERNFRTSFAVQKLQAWRLQQDETNTTGKRSRSSEDGGSDDGYNETEKRARRDYSNNRDKLLRTRVLSVSEYRDEVRRGHKPSNAPIAVPLFPGETVEEYERRFRAFLPTLSMDLKRLADEPNTERSVRLLFARKRLTGGLPPPLLAPANGRVVQVALASDVPKPSILSRVSDAPEKVETDSVESTTETVVTQANEEPMDPMLQFPRTCSLRPPLADADEAALPKAYLACGCRKCLLRCTSHLVRQVTQLQRDVDASASSATTHTVMDLTRDSDSSASSTASAVPPSPSPSTRIDVVKMLQIANLIQRHRHDVSLTVSHDDPVETQLRQQYDEINERVVVNERVLENASLQLEDAALGELTHVQAAAQTQDENLELRQYIDEEKDQRDAALAMLVVYTWRHTPLDLQARLSTRRHGAVGRSVMRCGGLNTLNMGPYGGITTVQRKNGGITLWI